MCRQLLLSRLLHASSCFRLFAHAVPYTHNALSYLLPEMDKVQLNVPFVCCLL